MSTQTKSFSESLFDLYKIKMNSFRLILACPVCGKTDWKRAVPNENHDGTIFVCRNCGEEVETKDMPIRAE